MTLEQGGHPGLFECVPCDRGSPRKQTFPAKEEGVEESGGGELCRAAEGQELCRHWRGEGGSPVGSARKY